MWASVASKTRILKYLVFFFIVYLQWMMPIVDKWSSLERKNKKTRNFEMIEILNFRFFFFFFLKKKNGDGSGESYPYEFRFLVRFFDIQLVVHYYYYYCHYNVARTSEIDTTVRQRHSLQPSSPGCIVRVWISKWWPMKRRRRRKRKKGESWCHQ